MDNDRTQAPAGPLPRVYRRAHLLRAAACLGAAWLAGRPAFAAGYPERPLKMVVPFPPGGAADLMSRSLAGKLGELLGQQVVVENRGGAGGTIAAEAVAAAPPDGYTLFFGSVGTNAINVSLYRRLRYDPLKHFEYVSLTHTTPRVLVVNAAVPARSVQELIVLAKARPGELSYGSDGNGSTSHLSGALFETMGGVNLLHVPYKGSAPLLTDLLAGRVTMTFDSLAVYADHLKSGRVRALGTTAASRMSALPDVPTISESGLPGYDVSNWLGVMVPAGTPRDVVARLHGAIVRSSQDSAIRQQLAPLGIETVSSTPEAFAALVRADIGKWSDIVKRSGATVD